MQTKKAIIISSVIASSVVGAIFLVLTPKGISQETNKANVSTAKTPVGKYTDADGTIHLPEDYRLKFTHLGTWSVNSDDAAKANAHDVYAEPDAVMKFRSTGQWPDGATIVKEVRSVRKDKMTTGNVQWDGEMILWFVMVKDSKNSFPDNPNWGRGWGWGLFKINDPKKNVSSDYTSDCFSCHIPAKNTDWIYTQGYPALSEKDGSTKKYDKSLYDSKATR